MKPPTFQETCEALKTGRFLAWPQEVQAAAIQTTDPKGWNPLHDAAINKYFFQIPKEFLTEELLLKTTRGLWTPLHYAAYNGVLGAIPKNVLTEQMLLTPDKDGESPLHYAAGNNYLQEIPIKMSLSTLRMLLRWENSTPSSQEWIKQEIQARQKEELRETLTHCNHPDL